MKLLLTLLLTLCFAVTNAIAAVNVNTATQAELETLNGIGPSKAKAIIDYRTKNGPFKTVEELDKVPGIGEGTMKKIQKDVTLSGATTAKAEKGSAKAAKAEKSSRSSSETKPETKAAEDKKETRKEVTRESKKEEGKQTERKSDDKRTTAKESVGSTQKDTKKSAAAAEEKKSGSAR